MKTAIDILGTMYTVELLVNSSDSILKECDGYTDWSSSRIVIADRHEECEIEDYKRYLRKVIRHELVHAFLFESGLGENFKHVEYGHEETMVDWIAFQMPKIEACATRINKEFNIEVM